MTIKGAMPNHIGNLPVQICDADEWFRYIGNNDAAQGDKAGNKKIMKEKVNNGKSTSQQLWIGGGIKLPAGKYRIDANNLETELGDVNAQAGTGSVDFILNTAYNIRFNKIGINTSAMYKLNTGNNEQYQFGNRFTASSFVFYATRIKSTALSPNAGIIYQHSATNYFNDAKVALTGGHMAMAAAGLELGLKKITIGGNMQIPFSQNFALGQTEAKPRAMFHLAFSL